jgi:hypothetical protein
LELSWQVVKPVVKDWSFFVHLVRPDGVIVAQQDDYPGRGTVATSDLPSGHAWQERIFVSVPEAAYTPGELEARAGWYYPGTGERLRLDDGSEMVALGAVRLEPRPSPLGVPNPLGVNFGDQIELLGYELSTLNPVQGEEIELTLFWRALRPVEKDYIVFAHLIHAATATGHGASDVAVAYLHLDARRSREGHPPSPGQPGRAARPIRAGGRAVPARAGWRLHAAPHPRGGGRLVAGFLLPDTVVDCAVNQEA